MKKGKLSVLSFPFYIKNQISCIRQSDIKKPKKKPPSSNFAERGPSQKPITFFIATKRREEPQAEAAVVLGKYHSKKWCKFPPMGWTVEEEGRQAVRGKEIAKMSRDYNLLVLLLDY